MIVAIDLDNTITDAPEFFAVLTKALIDSGHAVHVITYREPGTEDRARADLDALGIRYSELHLPQDWCEPAAWKAGLAADLGVQIFIEDSPEVLARMPKGVQRLWLCDPEVFDLDACVRALRER